MGPSSLSSPFLSPDSVDTRAFGEGEGTQGPVRVRHSAMHSHARFKRTSSEPHVSKSPRPDASLLKILISV